TGESTPFRRSRCHLGIHMIETPEEKTGLVSVFTSCLLLYSADKARFSKSAIESPASGRMHGFAPMILTARRKEGIECRGRRSSRPNRISFGGGDVSDGCSVAHRVLELPNGTEDMRLIGFR